MLTATITLDDIIRAQKLSTDNGPKHLSYCKTCLVAQVFHRVLGGSLDVTFQHLYVDKIDGMCEYYVLDFAAKSVIEFFDRSYVHLTAKDYLFFEGIDNWKRPTYQESKKEFSFCIWGNNYEFYAVARCIAAQVK